MAMGAALVLGQRELPVQELHLTSLFSSMEGQEDANAYLISTYLNYHCLNVQINNFWSCKAV